MQIVGSLETRELEALSQIDPEDEFLKSEKSYSLIEKLSSKNSSFEVLSAYSSEFSILSGSKMHSLITSLKNVDNSMSLASQIDSEPASQIEASLVDYLNSSKFSAVNYERDTYAEDIVI